MSWLIAVDIMSFLTAATNTVCYDHFVYVILSFLCIDHKTTKLFLGTVHLKPDQLQKRFFENENSLLINHKSSLFIKIDYNYIFWFMNINDLFIRCKIVRYHDVTFCFLNVYNFFILEILRCVGNWQKCSFFPNFFLYINFSNKVLKISDCTHTLATISNNDLLYQMQPQSFSAYGYT